MSKTATQEIAERKAKYAQLQYETDDLGRRIGVGRLTPSQQLRIQEWSPGLNGTTPVTIDDPKSENYGKTFEISQRVPLILAASVRQIDDAQISFPRNRDELNSVVDRLDEEGLKAAGDALAKFDVKKEEPDPTPEEVKDQAKN